MFYTYSQNNSGGSFVQDVNISHYVIIEASSASEANEKAEQLGIYFDGDGDCECCGNRWYELSDSWDKGDGVPSIYGEAVWEHSVSFGWMKDYETVVHYISGEILYYSANGDLVDI